MRIPIPTRFQAKHIILFAIGVFTAQLVLGTTIAFSVLTMLYIFLFALAFNVAGGLVYPSGAYIFFGGTLGALVGIVYKCIILEPGQTKLQHPELTMLVYCGGMASMAVAVWVSRRFRRKQGLLANALVLGNMRRAALSCLALGMLLVAISAFLPVQLYTALSQVNRFPELAMILSFYAEIKNSNGKRSVNWVGATAFLQVFVVGMLGFSKFGIFSPVFIWLLVCFMLGYSFSRLQIVGGVLVIWFMFYYLVPYAQIGRGGRGDFAQSKKVAIAQLEDLGKIRAEYDEDAKHSALRDDNGPTFFNTPQGFFDRLQMLGVDDALITFTDEHGTAGLIPTYYEYLNLIPHVFYPDKPTVGFGNLYARQMGLLPEWDVTTGISFGPVADAYHQEKWWGVFLLFPLVICLLFSITDALAGDVRITPWGLLPMVAFAHAAPEGLLGGAIYLTGFGTVALLLGAAVARYIVPIFFLTKGTTQELAPPAST